MGGPRIDRVERTSQATPFAEDFLKQLQGELAAYGLGTGVGPLQRESGTAIRQYLAGLQQRAAGLSQGKSPLLDAISKRNEEFVNRQAASLKDVFGASGARFGSQVARGESDLRRGAASDFAVTSAGTLLQEQQFLDQLLPAVIGQQFQMGGAALAPMLQLAQLGILPEEVIASPGLGQQLVGGGLTAAGAFLGGPAAAGLFQGGFGGGGGGGGINTVPFQAPSFSNPNIFSGAGFGMQGASAFSLPSTPLIDPRIMINAAGPSSFR